jgi:hypothetical protein
VIPDDQTSQPSILNENLPSGRALQPRQPLGNSQDPKASTGSVAEPDSTNKDNTDQDEIRLAPGQGADTQNVDPAKAQLVIADGLYIRKLNVRPRRARIRKIPWPISR